MIRKTKWAGGRAKQATAGILAGIFLTILPGCGKNMAFQGRIRNETGYSRGEIMVIAMTEKNRYEAVCTDQIWNVSLGDKEESFERYLIGQIQSFMDEIKIMNLLAAEREMTLTAKERADMSEAAEEYYSLLTEADISYMGVTKEAVQSLFEEYCLAERLVEDVTAGIDLEVSDSEAKVISIQQAECGDLQTAEQFLMRTSEENADFDACAEDAGLTVTVRQLGRGEEDGVFEEEAFSLETGEISPVIKTEGAYCVLKCLNDYDEEATASRKKMIFEERKRRAFQTIYDGFRENITLSYPENVWEEISLASGSHAVDADFFEIYRKYTD